MTITPMLPEHWEAVKTIYEEGIATGNATFQQSAPTWEEWNEGHLQACRFVALIDNKIAGWAALSKVSGRCVYAGVAEVSVYVGENYRGNGIGALLLNHLVVESEKNNLWTLQAGIFPENKGSLALHQKFDFRIVGKREKIGKMDGIWRDTILLERRSKVVGIE
ncbi:GNAT family N-acetyltransferase [Solitalea sp. MAHUQ-68]|uniref:GNAT family N-acetyltransferase n=1 Tax=Solitalea agri TaxID=2953739 RepID=A0A9X2JEX5_9SPHI|nr:GNAT family N-acetyltransferase [Solitalea agri]MCO4292856.1 GNAT family N-acetyltransferase [Solitalea agri]